MRAGIAAGHPATAEVGLRMLARGGSAADAGVAALLATCVTESILTGIGGGGFVTYFDASTATVTCLDFFCAVPGLDGDTRPEPMLPVEITFGEVPIDYLIGGASVAVPGVPAGAGEIHRRWGRLPWVDVVSPALMLAVSGVLLPAAQARSLVAVAPALLPGEGAGIYAPGGTLLRGGDLLHHPGLDSTLAMLAAHGPETFYTGEIAARTIAAVRDHGGCVGPADLAAYRVADVPVSRATFAGHTVHARTDLSATVRTLASLPANLAGMPRGERAVTLARAMSQPTLDRLGDTTNISAVDADGNACVITVTLGLGSGVWVPGLGLHLNSMLGEGELMSPNPVPGQRVGSNMCPLVVTDERSRLALAAGSAGATRIRSALIGTLIGIFVDGLETAAAICAPRLHVLAADSPGTPAVAHAEHGYPPEELDALASAGFAVNEWGERNHYFGGVSAVGQAGAGGDPRRGGVGLVIPKSGWIISAPNPS